jgi:hypothetical protein
VKTIRHLVYVLNLTFCLVLGMGTGEGLHLMDCFNRSIFQK